MYMSAQITLFLFLTLLWCSSNACGTTQGGQCTKWSFPNAAGWQAATPQELNMSAQLLNISLSRFPGTVLIIRCGYVVWRQGGDVSVRRKIWSIGKSLMALVTARLLERKIIPDLDAQLRWSNDPALAAKSLNISALWNFSVGTSGGPLRTFRQFLTMTSNFGLATSAGTACAYNNNAIEFLGTFLQYLVKESRGPVAMVRQQILDLLGIQDGVSLDGQVSGFAGGFSLSPRDLARVGLVMLRSGEWEGRQILPASWVADASQPQVPSSMPVSGIRAGDELWNDGLSAYLPYLASGHEGRMGGDRGYGFTFWIMPPDLEGCFHASGLKGNYVIIDPLNDLIVVVSNDIDSHPSAAAYLRAVRQSL